MVNFSCRSFIVNDTPTPVIYPLSLHDALPISWMSVAKKISDPEDDRVRRRNLMRAHRRRLAGRARQATDRKSTRLNSSHVEISYAVFCLKKKNTSESPMGKKVSSVWCALAR